MKRIITMSGLLLITLGIFSCSNQKWSFPDFTYTTTYFPNQYPVRTLIFGDYIYDNSMDNQLQFIISATTGGVYNQTKDITVGYVVDNTLCTKLNNGGTGRAITAMPSSWYTLSNTTQMVIPKGSFSGGVTVQLTAGNFTADTNSVTPYWAIPLRMTTTTADSILSGRTGLTTPDRRIAGNWAVVPKDFTIFCLRYVNEWHGNYLVRGTDIVTQAGVKIDSVKYHQQYLEGNTVMLLTTSRRNQVKYSNTIKRTSGSPGSYEMKLDFGATDITLATLTTTTRYPTAPVAGTAKMVLAKDKPVDNKGNLEAWGNLSRNTIYLAYTITVGTTLHTVNDTLVFRDKAVTYADFAPVVLP